MRVGELEYRPRIKAPAYNESEGVRLHARDSSPARTASWWGSNYPPEVSVPLGGRASHLYLFMAGSTNWMQSRFDNGEVVVLDPPLRADRELKSLTVRTLANEVVTGLLAATLAR